MFLTSSAVIVALRELSVVCTGASPRHDFRSPSAELHVDQLAEIAHFRPLSGVGSDRPPDARLAISSLLMGVSPDRQDLRRNGPSWIGSWWFEPHRSPFRSPSCARKRAAVESSTRPAIVPFTTCANAPTGARQESIATTIKCARTQPRFLHFRAPYTGTSDQHGRNPAHARIQPRVQRMALGRVLRHRVVRGRQLERAERAPWQRDAGTAARSAAPGAFRRRHPNSLTWVDDAYGAQICALL